MTPNDIDTRAPVISRHSAVIEAPIEVLWGLHTGVDAWPSWQPDIETARLDGPFAPGSTFSWHTGGLDIDSTIYRVEPERRTLWGGPAHGIVGIHEWTFTPLGDGVVRVETAESWSGEPIVADVGTMQDALDGSLVDWLGHLRTLPGPDLRDATAPQEPTGHATPSAGALGTLVGYRAAGFKLSGVGGGRWHVTRPGCAA